MTDAERDCADQLGARANNGRRVDPDNVSSPPRRPMRPSAHGDVRALAAGGDQLRHPTDDPPKVVVFYGGNDGVLRAVNGNRSARHRQRAGRQRDVVVRGAGVLSARQAPARQRHADQLPGQHDDDAGPQPKPYGFDGSITAYYATSTTRGSSPAAARWPLRVRVRHVHINDRPGRARRCSGGSAARIWTTTRAARPRTSRTSARRGLRR